MTDWFQILLGNVNSPCICSLGRSYIPGVTGNPNLWEAHDIRGIIVGFLDQSRSLFDTLLQVIPFGLSLDCCRTDALGGGFRLSLGDKTSMIEIVGW